MSEPTAAPVSHPEQLFLSAERVNDAVGKLNAVDLGQKWSQFLQWLFLKRSGLQPGQMVEVSSDECRRFAIDFFGLPVDDDYGYFFPHLDDWQKSTGSTDWAVQTLYTQIGRPSKKLQTFATVDAGVRFARGDRMVAGHRVSFVASPEYETAIEKLFRQQVPLEELAVWRYRVQPLRPGVEVEDLVKLLKSELQLSAQEVDAVFSSQPHSGADSQAPA